MTVREFVDRLHRELLHSFPRGPSPGHKDATDHWSRPLTKADLATIKTRVGAIAESLLKE